MLVGTLLHSSSLIMVSCSFRALAQACQQRFIRQQKNVSRAALFCVALVCNAGASAGLIIEGTRVIYRGGAPEVVVKVSNQGSNAALMQTWIDDGRANATPDQLDVPFFLTPPLARVEPGKGQTLRIFHTESLTPLPTDRETLFWLNVLDIPPRQDGGEDAGAVLQISVRSRLKLFYRPKGLDGSADAAPGSLAFSQKGSQIEISNPTPYYVNLRDLEYGPAEKPAKQYPATMIAPFASATLEGAMPGISTIRYSSISDLGAIFAFEKSVTRTP